MELTKEQEVRLGNFGEQFASIRKNVEVANVELEAILKAKDTESVAFESRLKEHSETMAKLRIEKEEVIDFIITERARIAGDSRKLEAEQKEFDIYKLETISAIELERAAIESERKNALKEIESMKESIRTLSSDIEILGAQVMKLSEEENSLVGNIKVLNDMKSVAEESVKYFEQQRDETLALADKEIKAKQQELIDIEARIQEEIKKIEVPQRTLIQQQQEFENYRMDVRVLYDRANRMWCAMYPGQSLEDILIKQ